MNKLILPFLFFLVAVTAYAQPPQVPADSGAVFGAATTPDGAIPVGQITSLLENTDSVSVKVTAKVLDVCPKKGCWMLLEMPDQSKVFVKMKDYEFFVPTALTGKTVVIDGEAEKLITSVKELKHYAEDAGKSKKEIDAITEPKTEIRLIANGIVVVK